MTDIVTYQSANSKPNERWLAYIVLPDDNHWLVRFTGETEEIAKAKAISLYESEKIRLKVKPPEAEFVNPWARTDSRGQHFKGKAWLIHSITREKIRVELEQVESYIAKGYERGGTRSK